MNDNVKISKERKQEMRLKIKDYFLKERDEDLGELASELILDFFIKELGPIIYNQGVEDAQVYIRDKLDDLYALQIRQR